MKKLRILFAAAFVLAISSAFVTKKNTLTGPTQVGWAEPWISPTQCIYMLLDDSYYNYYCSTYDYGPVCTIYGTPAYGDEFGCEYGWDFNLLHRPQ